VPWKCPACQIAIRHDQEAPLPRQIYRCHVCRLELIVDPETQKLTLAPLPATIGDPDATHSKR
jgi:hypothetical protein